MTLWHFLFLFEFAIFRPESEGDTTNEPTFFYFKVEHFGSELCSISLKSELWRRESGVFAPETPCYSSLE